MHKHTKDNNSIHSIDDSNCTEITGYRRCSFKRVPVSKALSTLATLVAEFWIQRQSFSATIVASVDRALKCLFLMHCILLFHVFLWNSEMLFNASVTNYVHNIYYIY